MSLGTGSYTSKIRDADSQHKGELFWATRISDIMMKGVSLVTDYEMREMLNENENYLRLTIDIDVEEYAEMSNSSSEVTNYLIGKTNDMLNKNKDLLKHFLQNILRSN